MFNLKLKGIFNDLFFSTVQFCVSGLFPLIVIVLISTRFSIQIWGDLTLIQTIAALFLLIVNYGTDSFGIREISRIQKLKSIKAFVLKVYTVRTINFFIILLIFLYPIINYFHDLGIYVFLILLSNTISPFWVFVGLKKLNIVVIFEFIIRVTAILLMIFFVKNDSDIILYLIILSSSAAIIGVFSIAFLLKIILVENMKKSNIDLINFYRKLTPFFSSQIFSQAYITLPIVIVGFKLGNSYAAIYGNSEKFQRLFRGLISPIGRVLLSYSSDIKRSIKFFKYWKLIFVVGLTFSVFIISITGYIVKNTFGSEYNEMIIISSILFLAIPIIYLSSFFVNTIIFPNNLEKVFNKYLIIISTTLTVSIFLFVEKIDLIGISILAVSAELILFILLLFKSKKIINNAK